MMQENLISEELTIRLDIAEEAAEWCDHCSQGHPIY